MSSYCQYFYSKGKIKLLIVKRKYKLARLDPCSLLARVTGNQKVVSKADRKLCLKFFILWIINPSDYIPEAW